MEKVMKDLYPIWDVEHDCILSKRGDLTLGFRLELPEIFTLSDADYQSLHHAWVKAIRLLPNHTVLAKQDWFTEEKFEADFSGGDMGFLARASALHFNERPYLDHQCYLFLTKKADGRKDVTSIFSNLISSNHVPEQTINTARLEDFKDVARQFARVLEATGLIRAIGLTNEALLSSRRGAGIIERYLSLESDGRFPAKHDIIFDANAINVGTKQAQLFTISDEKSLPGLCGSRINYDKYSTDKSKFSIGFASSLGQLLPCNHIYSQYVVIGDAQHAIKQLEAKRLRLQSLSAYSRENTISRDAVNDFLNEAIAEQRMPVQAHYNVLAWSDEPHRMKDIRTMVSTAMAQIDAVCKQETVGAPQIFWAGIPGNAAELPVNETFSTFAEQASCFFNAETGYRTSVSPFGVRLGDRLTGKPVHVDISDEPIRKGYCTNRNKFILGPSGSGKSFVTNHIMHAYHALDAHIILVDVGHSYKGLCDLAEGYYFTYTEQDPIKFNPFYIGPGDSLDTEKKESIKTLLIALWKKDDEQYKRSEYVALSNAITGYFSYLVNHPAIFPCFDTFYEFLKDEYVQCLIEDGVKEKDFDVANFLYVLRPYYKGGEFDYLLNASENLDLFGQRFIVFELDNIKDHPILFPVVTIIIMEVFINKMRKLQGIRKTILIEEAWKALMKEGFAAYIKYLFKTVRKFFGEAIVVTQEVEDIISSPIVKQAIINNSDCKILLDQSKYQQKFDQIQELLGLTEKEKALVLSVNRANDSSLKYKEVFISLGGVMSKVYRTEVSPEEYYVYTTEQPEKVEVMAYAEKYGSMEKGIRQLVNDKR